jgi:CIC family chloride channel protein
MRRLLAVFVSALSSLLSRVSPKTRRAVQLLILGALVGLVTVAFHYSVEWLYEHTVVLAAEQGVMAFLVASFLIVGGASVLASLAVKFISPAAGGGGVMPTKIAFWKDFGVMPFRTAVAKFVGSTLTLGGGVSMGPEGPAVQIGAATASSLGGWMGVAKQERRALCACGAAAALAAAFNAPLAAILFVLEEIVGDLNSRLISGILLSAVTGALVAHALIGAQPAYQVAPLGDSSWTAVGLSVLVALVATVAGVLFQKMSLKLRGGMKGLVPAKHEWLKPVAGGLLSWAVAAAAFLLCGQLGVFGIGYRDVTQAIAGGFTLKTAGILFAGKWLATVFAVGAGACGGIFAPSFFIGAMSGATVVALAHPFVPLAPSDSAILVMVGMCACLGAVIRTPLTCVLLIFEVTHQFSVIPMALLATLISQLVAKRLQKEGMYESMLRQDGQDPHRVLPPRDYRRWREMHVGTIAQYQPVVATDLSATGLRGLIDHCAYARFPVVDADGKVTGILTRDAAEESAVYGNRPALHPAHWISPASTLAEAQAKIIESPGDFLCVGDAATGKLEGVLTLHDFLRAQQRLSDEAES